MANGLLDLLGGLGTTPPAYLEGLLGAQPVEDLRKRSIGTGLANALVGYLAMPKNQNLGLGRILAGTAQAGIGGAQGVYDTATADYMQQQKIEEMQRAKQQRVLQQQAITQAATQFPEYADAIRANPELLKEIIAARIKPVVRKTFVAPDGSIRFEDTGEVARTENVAKPEKQDLKVVGNNLVDAAGNVIYTAPPTPKEPPSSIQEYNFAKGQGYAGTFEQFKKEMTKAGATNINMPSESERTAGFLTNRLQTAIGQINKVVTNDPNAAAPKIGAEAVKFLTGSDYLKNLTNPAARQQIENAQLELLDSALTLGTGAAYTREQLQNYSKSYFPQLGDKPQAIKDKQDRLKSLLNAAKIKAGRAAPEDIGLPANVTVERVQ
jgi:hypothetical protein